MRSASPLSINRGVYLVAKAHIGDDTAAPLAHAVDLGDLDVIALRPSAAVPSSLLASRVPWPPTPTIIILFVFHIYFSFLEGVKGAQLLRTRRIPRTGCGR